MRAGHWIALGVVAAVFVSIAGGGSLQPPAGPVTPSMTTLDDIYAAVGGPVESGSAYVKIGDVVGDVTTPGLAGFIRVKSWSGHEFMTLTVEPGRAAPGILQKWRIRERLPSVELRVFDAQGVASLVMVFTLPKITSITTKGLPSTLDIMLDCQVDTGNTISWTHPGTNTTFTYNPKIPYSP